MEDLIVNEIFHSIQGESSHAGRPCVFVRLTYCNLRCSYCDTEYAFEEGTRMTIAEIVREVESFGCRLVEVTGGEPLMQYGSLDLMRVLCDAGFEVLLETGGSLDISRVDPRVKRIVDFKCPGSRMAKKNQWENTKYLRTGDEVKFVVGDRADFDWALERISEHQIAGKCQLLFSPVFGVLEPSDLATWLLQSGLNARFQIQMHKYIWEPSTRGV
jgi:7-carboxy-7-deazaguanine synthase